VKDCQVEIHNQQANEIDASGLESLVQTIWAAEGERDAQLSIILVDDKTLTALNEKFLGRDYLTDVIAFPISDHNEPVFEGEIYISVQRILDNASTFSVAASDELMRIAAHGVLHFLGYGDKQEADKKEMSKRENHYLEIVGAGEMKSGREP